MARRLETAQAGHRDVHEDEVGPQPLHQRDGLPAVAGHADHLVAPCRQQRGDPVPEERVIVGEDDPHGGAPPSAGPEAASTGTASRTTAPASAPDDHSIVPPIDAARSRIAASP